jgi:hypothetical protein
MVLLGDLRQVEARFGPFGDSIKLGERWQYGLRRMYDRHGNLFRHTQFLGDVGLVEARFGLLGDSINFEVR